MSKFALILALFAFNASAAHVLLEKHAVSGLMIPENSFKKDCSIFREGYVESYTKKGDGTIIGFTHMVTARRIFEIKQLLRVARRAGIAEGAILCDAGSISVTGHYAGKAVMLKAQKDCDSNRFRKGWAAQRLRNIASNLCAF